MYLHHRTHLLVLAALVPGAMACTETTSSCDRVGPTPVRALTFNAGLATNFVAYAPERLDKIGPAVAGTQADIVCLQEVWTDAHAAKVGADLLATYPYQHRVVTTDPSAGGAPACSAAEADPLAVCVNANCVGAESLAECALGNCFTEYSAAGDGCKTCLAANIGQNSIAVIFDACAKGSSSLAFDGRNGLLLLSKTPLTDTGHVVMDSYLNTRIALHANTVPASGEPLSVVCTHLTAVLPGVAYSGKHADWAAEQAAQIGVLRQTAASVRGERNQVILGDFNTGPALAGGIAAEVPANYTLLVGSGDDAWRSVMVEASTPDCSWCADNPLNTEGTTNLIDHTLLAGPWKKRSATSARVLDELVTLQVSGQAKPSRLSDHYGILTEVATPAPACE